MRTAPEADPLPEAPHLTGLNAQQRIAAEHGVPGEPPGALPGPLLVIAGAGSGKTNTLAHRVAHLLVHGADPRRVLLLTFTRRAAQEMIRRAERIRARAGGSPGGADRIEWAGTFHAVANRLLRLHARTVGLDPAFTILDREDAADLLNLLRAERGLAKREARFPQKGTCLAIYSHAVNAQRPLQETLDGHFPWCADWADELRGLFAAYVDAKARRHLLDYDDLLLYWYHLMGEPGPAEQVRRRFDHVLVDEYQDTNALQAGILLGLKPDGRGLTVVGDDAQAIFGFRAATVRNILDFPGHFEPPARVVTLERNYRSTQPILDAANAVIALAPERFTKDLFTRRPSRGWPALVTVADEIAQVDYVIERVLAHREAGIHLRRQAVLARAAHHTGALEVELGRRNIPFVKYGGLRFLEAAHVKDVLCILRWAENPRDEVAAFRVLLLLPGVGPAHARRALEHLAKRRWSVEAMADCPVPGPAADDWPGLAELMGLLRGPHAPWAGQLERVRRWYEPHLERHYDAAPVRARDLEQLEGIALAFPSRERFLAEVTLDPPDATGDEAGAPLLDEDWLVLSTIHSAKGREWDAVFVLNVVDGCIPSDMSTGSAEEIEEERRLLHVAMTRARDHLHLVQPLRFYTRPPRAGDGHVYAPRSRFLPDSLLDRFERVTHGATSPGSEASAGLPDHAPVDVAARLRAMWEPEDAGGGEPPRG